MPRFQALRDYLEIHKQERNGIIVLIILITLVLIGIIIVPYVVKPEIVNQDAVLKEMNILIAQRDSALLAEKVKKENKFNYSDSNFSKGENQTSKRKEKGELELFTFDPNSVSDGQWQKLGLNTGQIRTIRNYQSKGGSFKKPSDLSKMYSIPQEQFETLEPYIKIQTEPFDESKYEEFTEIENQSKEKRNSNWEDWSTIQINLNTADTTEFKKLKGIGSFYAKKMVEYREELGGYISPAQLLEIWKFDEGKLSGIEDNIHCTAENLKKISVNTAEAEELAGHPYLSWNQAKALVAYREKHGNFNLAKDIKKCHLITEETWKRIAPYLRTK